MSLLSRLRQAASEADHLTFAYGGGDASELVALVREIADREHCTIDYTLNPSSELGTVTVWFMRRTEVPFGPRSATQPSN
jgi:hypothetical protein